jgi:hypothetical protein
MESISIDRGESTTSAKDFFLHLGSIVALYAVAISFVNLLFKIINKSYPEITNYYYFGASSSQISLSVSILIIVFPLFIILSYFINKAYQDDEHKKYRGVRKWLVYITLFVAGIIFTGDLVTVLYKFLDGQDLTWAFVLKAITVLGVTGVVFGYYIQEIRERVTKKSRRLYAIISGLIILASIILGFIVVGSPATQRLIRYDNQKIADLQNIQWQVINHWQTKGSLPDSLETISLSTERNTNEYTYTKTGELTFSVCTEFNKQSDNNTNKEIYSRYPYSNMEDWSHPQGYHCFERTIDIQMYPTMIKG